MEHTPGTPQESAAGPLSEPLTPTRARKNAFLEEYAKVGNVSKAAEIIGINRRTHYEWLELDAEYAAQFKDAEAQYCDLIRETVRERAIFGTQHEIWFKGTMVGYRTEHSDRLLELLAKAKCPEYRDKQEIQISGEVKHVVERLAAARKRLASHHSPEEPLQR